MSPRLSRSEASIDGGGVRALGGIYSSVARARRSWLSRPGRQRQLTRPVVSVGNLAMGGSGKTPLTLAVASLLGELGERPVVLSRGYRRRSRDPLVVVSYGSGPVVDVQASGDEPQLLARALPGVPVIVCADRHRAGQWAEHHLDVTVHVLDDGFQHLRLARDLDLVLVSPADLDEYVVPTGRLREPLDAASSADAVLVPGSDHDCARVAQSLDAAMPVFRVVSQVAPPRWVHPYGQPADGIQGDSVLALAGIARPERFFESTRAAGFDVRTTRTYPDHHWFDASDVEQIERTAHASAASVVVTTEKDAVRLEVELSRCRHALRWAYLPYRVMVEPPADFRAWFSDRLRHTERARAAGPV